VPTAKNSSSLHGRSNGYVLVRVRADEVAALAALAPRTGEKQATAAYEGLRDGCASLQKRTLTYMDGQRKHSLNWVLKAVYHEGEGGRDFILARPDTVHLHAALVVRLV
jgi:hypothetical protein